MGEVHELAKPFIIVVVDAACGRGALAAFLCKVGRAGQDAAAGQAGPLSGIPSDRRQAVDQA